MKLVKSYTAKIEGNKDKIEYLRETLKTIQEMSDYIFSLGKDKWFNQKELYRILRTKYPSLKSKVLQQFMQLYLPSGKKKLPKKKAIKSSIILDNQNFDIQLRSDNKLSSIWLRFHRINFPLISNQLLEKLKDCNLKTDVKYCQIFLRKDKLYCKVSIVKEVTEPVGSSNPIAIDLNTKTIVSSKNKFYNLKKLFHVRYERNKKNNWKSKNINNIAKNQIHLVTNEIVSDLKKQKSEVLIVEDLNFKRSQKQFAKKENFVKNTFCYGILSNQLEYKCIENGIKFVKVNPMLTSKLCWNCGGLNTARPKQNKFVCLDCNYKVHADLNASRNILDCYKNPQKFLKLRSEWAKSQSSPVEF